MIEIGVQPFTLKQARRSTLTVAVVLALTTAWQLYRGHQTVANGFGIATGILVIAAFVPPAAKFFHKWWMTLASVLGYVNSRILLGILYYLVMTPVGLVARVAGHDPLYRRTPRSASYWHRRPQTRQTREGYERAY